MVPSDHLSSLSGVLSGSLSHSSSLPSNDRSACAPWTCCIIGSTSELFPAGVFFFFFCPGSDCSQLTVNGVKYQKYICPCCSRPFEVGIVLPKETPLHFSYSTLSRCFSSGNGSHNVLIFIFLGMRNDQIFGSGSGHTLPAVVRGS